MSSCSGSKNEPLCFTPLCPILGVVNDMSICRMLYVSMHRIAISLSSYMNCLSDYLF